MLMREAGDCQASDSRHKINRMVENINQMVDMKKGKQIVLRQAA